MRLPPIFADTFYWIALLDRRDNFHARVSHLTRALGRRRIVTTQEVLVEVLAAFSAQPRSRRETAAAGVRRILANPNVEVQPQSEATFLAGLVLYEARPDKEYSLVDCVSMLAMRTRGITEVLTHDHHFVQEGFVALLRDLG